MGSLPLFLTLNNSGGGLYQSWSIVSNYTTLGYINLNICLCSMYPDTHCQNTINMLPGTKVHLKGKIHGLENKRYFQPIKSEKKASERFFIQACKKCLESLVQIIVHFQSNGCFSPTTCTARNFKSQGTLDAR